MDKFDVVVFRALNQHAGSIPVLDAIMTFLAEYALELDALWLIVAWFTLPREDEEKRHALVVAVAGGALALLVNVVIGTLWYRARPFTYAGFGAHKLIPHSADGSFPSDHTSGGFGIASALWGQGPRWLCWTFTICSTVVAVARIYVGVHWPTDVIAGMVIGIGAGRLAHGFSRPLRVVTNLGLRMFRMGQYAGHLRR
ncbi:hypothetical protein N007_04265 [Alicyclobacillus acidoterrestris ATCC 49025]|nr:hypothetical protein N007_04265 [Alicyclobacillus acidoterrestris ATCC 49025]